MARIRTIKPEIWTDEKFVELSPFARLLFIGLWNFADDAGRMAYSPKKIKMQIFPADSPDISALFGELEKLNMIHIYDIDGNQYLQIRKFADHQKIDKRYPSKIPAPANSPQLPPTEWNGMEWNGMEIEGNGKSSAKSKIDFSLKEKTWSGITGEQVALWEKAFPAIDIEHQLAKAANWLLSNPKNRKKNYARFLNNWFSRAQDRAPRLQQSTWESVIYE